MIDFVVELQSVLLGIVVTTALSLVTALSRRAYYRRRDRSVWDRKSDRITVLLSTSRTKTGTYSRPVTGLGQARAVGMIAPLLTRCYRTTGAIAVDLSVFGRDRGLEGDLILLGGPKNNEVTRRALALLDEDLPVTMKTDGDERLMVRTNEGEEEFKTEHGLPQNGVEGADYGLIVRARNCFDRRGTLTIFAGTHTYGTIAAVRYLLENDREIGHLGDQFVVVVKSLISAGEHVERPTLVMPPAEF